MLDGFYVGYMSAEGYGVVLFVFRGENIVGVDAGGVLFDGIYKKDPRSGEYSGKILVKAPPNIEVIQGVNTGENGLEYEVPFLLPENFLDAPFVKLSTPFGAVNIKLDKLRDLGATA